MDEELNELRQKTKEAIEEADKFKQSMISNASSFMELGKIAQRSGIALLSALNSAALNAVKLQENTRLKELENAAAQRSLAEAKKRSQLAVQTQKSNLEALAALRRHRQELESEVNGLGKLSDIRERQIALKKQEIDQLKSVISSSAQEAEKKKEALDVQTELIRSRIDELRASKDSAKSGDKGEIKRKIKELRQQEESLISEYSGLEAEIQKSKVGMNDLSQKESELAILQQKLAEVNKKHLNGIEQLTKEEDGHASAIQSLTKKIEEQKSEIEKATKAEKLATQQMKKKADELKAAKIKQFGENLSNISRVFDVAAKAITSLIAEIRKTQQAFGVAAGQAGKMQLGAVAESFKSMFTEGPMVGREEVMGARSAFQSEFGGVISSDAAGDLAKEAKKLGITPEQMAQSRRVFMTSAMGNLGEAKAQEEQFTATFRQQGLTNKDAMEAIGKYSELYARNGNRFAQSFTKAAAEAKKIGVDLGKIDQIGDNIIGDYEGFLEKTAELGAMGFNIDAQRLGEISETGDTGALMSELRSQLASTGKDITQLRRSEQLSLSSAFGIPMAELQRLAAPTADSGEKKDPIEESNTLLSTIINKLEVLGSIFSGVSKVLTGVIAVSTAITATATSAMALSGGGGIVKGLTSLIPGATSAAAAGTAGTAGAAGAATAAGTAAAGTAAGTAGAAGTTAAKVAGASTLAVTGTVVGGLAAGLYAGDKMFNKSVAAGGGGNLADFWRYNVMGGDNDKKEQEAMEAQVRQIRAQRAVRPQSEQNQPQQPQQPQGVNMAELSAKLDQVVRAIASMEVKLDGQKVGRIIVANEQRVAQSAPFRGQMP